MKPKKYNKSKKRPKESVEEPVSIHGNKSITFFNSLEEMNEYDAQEMAKLSPIQHLQNVTYLIKRAFISDLKKDFNISEIYFKK